MRTANLVVAGALVVALALGGAACSGGDNRDEERFCELIRTNRELLLGVSIDPESTAAALAVYDQVVDVAPSRISRDARTIRTLFRELDDLDFTDDAAFGEAFEKLFNLDTRNAAERFTDYVEEQCGVNLRTVATVPSSSTSTPPPG